MMVFEMVVVFSLASSLEGEPSFLVLDIHGERAPLK